MVPFFGPEDRDSYPNMPATDHKYIVLGARPARVERRDTLAEATVLTDKIALTLYMEREGNMKFRVRIAWVSHSAPRKLCIKRIFSDSLLAAKRP